MGRCKCSMDMGRLDPGALHHYRIDSTQKYKLALSTPMVRKRGASANFMGKKSLKSTYLY